MRTDAAQPVRLVDYRPPAFTITDTQLDIALDGDRTIVRARLAVERRDASDEPLTLDGERLELIAVSVDGQPLSPDAYTHDETSLVIPGLGERAVVETEVAFSPKDNTALSGIYLSQDRLFSQCEPEGFRRITYFLDRPDILSRFEVRLEGDRERFPHLLSNGNLVDSGASSDGRHWALWRDPFPKPSYLFATVAGGFDVLEDSFTTRSGRNVDLKLYSDPGDKARLTYALDALKRAMRWDEETFGREYDLDLFMIVAVRDFNFGAMENKGLNIFNSSLLLADPDTASDLDYERIESVVAHEYFHNWTGNRITCRDWFQLCLKEGLTVYRDQAFSADQRGHAIQRIKGVRRLRSVQFAEDGGPLAHPVRPGEYMKIDNFYTATVYEKGAELIHVLRNIIGDTAFAHGMDMYFERFDGQAATMEDFIGCFADASGQDLSAFLAWYGQAGTPVVTVEATHDAADKTLSVTLRQTTPPTPGQADKAPVAIPVRLGALGPDGESLRLVREDEAAHADAFDHTLVLTEAEQTWRFNAVASTPTLSVLRNFSAPVNLDMDEPEDALALRARADTDAFNQWEARQTLGRRALRATLSGDDAAAERAAAAYAAAVGDTVRARGVSDGLKALALTPPDEMEIAQLATPFDPDAVRAARTWLSRTIAEAAPLEAVLDTPRHPFVTDPAAADARALRNAALMRLADLTPNAAAERAQAQLDGADNLTDRLTALAALDVAGADSLEDALAAFHARWRDQPLIIDKWFALQASTRRAGAAARVAALLEHPDYDARTPNRVRAVVGAFAFGNLTGFHSADGAGYALIREQLLTLDARNPVLAARLAGAFEVWPRLEPGRAAQARATLEALQSETALSENTREIVTKMLGGEAD